jgi:hypothetical protein
MGMFRMAQSSGLFGWGSPGAVGIQTLQIIRRVILFGDSLFMVVEGTQLMSQQRLDFLESFFPGIQVHDDHRPNEHQI